MGFYTLYKDTSGLWRWKYTAGNGKVIAMSSESYHNKADAINAINLMKASGSANIYDG